jgi:hypothetical protein
VSYSPCRADASLYPRRADVLAEYEANDVQLKHTKSPVIMSQLQIMREVA